MKIELKPPFNVEFTKGYVHTSNSDSRKRVTMYRLDGTGTVISYARYIVSVTLGRFLTEREEVDHINTDPTDDRLENLQVLSIEDHKIKSASEKECQKDNLTCSYCGIIFQRPSRISKYKSPRNVFCSYSCNGKFHPVSSKSRKINDDDIKRILQMIVDGYTGYRIAKEIDKVSNSAIMRWIRILEKQYNVKYKHG